MCMQFQHSTKYGCRELMTPSTVTKGLEGGYASEGPQPDQDSPKFQSDSYIYIYIHSADTCDLTTAW